MFKITYNYTRVAIDVTIPILTLKYPIENH